MRQAKTYLFYITQEGIIERKEFPSYGKALIEVDNEIIKVLTPARFLFEEGYSSREWHLDIEYQVGNILQVRLDRLDSKYWKRIKYSVRTLSPNEIRELIEKHKLYEEGYVPERFHGIQIMREEWDSNGEYDKHETLILAIELTKMI